MYNELTESDIKKMQEEIDYRMTVVRPRITRDIVEAKAHGDLSENAEYRASKRENGQNEGRIEYLQAMIRTAKIIKPNENKNEVGIFDKVTVEFEEDSTLETFQISTTMQNDASKGIISKDSPFGRAVFGKKVGDRVLVKVSFDYSYYVTIKKIEKSTENGVDLPIS